MELEDSKFHFGCDQVEFIKLGCGESESGTTDSANNVAQTAVPQSFAYET